MFKSKRIVRFLLPGLATLALLASLFGCHNEPPAPNAPGYYTGPKAPKNTGATGKTDTGTKAGAPP